MTGLDELPLREDLRGQEPYGAPQLDVPFRLNTNENPYPPSASLVADIGRAAAAASTDLNRYPDREAWALRQDLATYLAKREGVHVDAAQVWAANGSNEVMHQLFLAFGGPGRTALGFAPTYSMYPEYCRDTFTAWVTAPRAPDFTLPPEVAREAVRRHQPTLVVVPSPNNPTGTSLAPETVLALLDATHDDGGVVVVDEAYAEFRRPGTPSALSLLADHPRLVVIRTMSKAFAMAGGRLGYLVGSTAVVDAVRIVRLPYHLSAVAQAVARTAIAHADELLASVDALREERDALVTWLRRRDFDVADSDANFVLFGRFADRHAVWERLLARGVLIRETGPDGWLRVSVGTPEEMAAFRRSLVAVLEEVGP
ncbi:MAG TPA: histidinol-phosphate transaminase [Actinomycetes bacterium]|nr:histidinol-phosphate transaminase [Actinomycetes bacterium]